LAAASRLGRLLLVELVVSRASEINPFPLTNEVTSYDSHTFSVHGCGGAMAVAPVAGLLLYVMPVSDQLVSATDLRLIAVVVESDLYTLTVAFVGAVARPVTLNFRYETAIGEPSTFTKVAVPKFDVGWSDCT